MLMSLHILGKNKTKQNGVLTEKSGELQRRDLVAFAYRTGQKKLPHSRSISQTHWLLKDCGGAMGRTL